MRIVGTCKVCHRNSVSVRPSGNDLAKMMHRPIVMGICFDCEKEDR